jgi:hypothetical protein
MGPIRDPATGSPRIAVVAELFTSEGCSSCPPADDLLSALADQQPIDGVEVLALGEHVDYWDRLGWRDPFSAALFTNRQSQYDERVFRANQVYTPQLVADGQFQCIGSDRDAVRRTLMAAAARPKAAVVVEARHPDRGGVDVEVRVEVPAALARREHADVVVALTQDRLVSRVQRGENGGRTLTHDAVVRSLAATGDVAPTAGRVAVTTRVAIDPSWDVSTLRIVAFVQERQSRRILGGGASAVHTP